MFHRTLAGVALVLAAVPLGAQSPTQKPAPAKVTPSTQGGATPYVPAIMRPRMVLLTGCLQHKEDYVLTEATLAEQGGKEGAQAESAPAPAPAYRLEGISAARLSMLVGKRVQVSGAYQGGDQTKSPGADGTPPRFEATNVTEIEGACAPAGS